jgi:hypothetical protein
MGHQPLPNPTRRCGFFCVYAALAGHDSFFAIVSRCAGALARGNFGLGCMRGRQSLALAPTHRQTPQILNPRDPGIQRQRRGIVVDHPTKLKSLAPLGPASSGNSCHPLSFPTRPDEILVWVAMKSVLHPRASPSCTLLENSFPRNFSTDSDTSSLVRPRHLGYLSRG